MTTITIPAPFVQYRDHVRSEWIDHNQHMNMGYYLVVLDFATDAWFEFIGLTRQHRQQYNVTTFTLEAHITYQREVAEGDPLRFATRLIDFDSKRIHYFHQMYHAGEGYLAATNELMSLHVNRETRRAAAMTPQIQQRLAQIKQAHAQLPLPEQVGRMIGLTSKPAAKT